ncbi:hypothetical protein BH23BAC3_BH23BAC3_22580 [soil metagenome]
MPDKWLSNYSVLSIILILVSMTATGVLPTEDKLTYTETIQKKAHFENYNYTGNLLSISTIYGNVSVEKHSGDAVEITAEKQIRAHQKEDLNRGIKEMKLVVEEEGDQILIYLDAPFVHHNKSDRGVHYTIEISREEIGYEFVYDITVIVPQNVDIYATSIIGDVSILQIDNSELIAKSVNGNIHLLNVSGKTTATTVNGNVTATHRKSPSGDSEYKTVNGTIEVFFPENLSADIHFSSLHGHLYTDFKDVERITATVESNISQNNGTRFRINHSSPFRIGDGGTELRFNVLNGNVYIKKLKI